MAQARDRSEDVDEWLWIQKFQDVPARHMSIRTRTKLSLYLNPLLASKDWKEVACCMEFNFQEIQNFSRQESTGDPMNEVLRHWTVKNNSLSDLLSILLQIERIDVLTDLKRLFEQDALKFREMQERGGIGSSSLSSSPLPLQVPEVDGNYPFLPETPELRGITLNDHMDSSPELFDAYVCYCDHDTDFVLEMVESLEKEPYKMKLCVHDRDLIPGSPWATATAELIQNRCKRMVIVLSPDFINSPRCDFQTKFALSLNPGARMKKMVPLMYKPCTVPTILQFITVCDFTRKELRSWCWKRLHGALMQR